MKSRIICAAVMSATMLYGTTGHAQESLNFMNNNPAQTCSDAAAVAASTASAPADGMLACDDATSRAQLARGDLAATYLNRGVLWLVRGDYAAAVADDEKALSLQGDLTEAWIDRGAALAAERRFAEAAADFTKALTFDLKKPQIVYFNRALAREDLGDFKGAYLDYAKAAELDPSWDKPKHELARFTVAHAGES